MGLSHRFALPLASPMEISDHSPFRVSSWTVYPRANELLSDGDEDRVRITPKMMGALLSLARTPGEVVTRDALFDDVWPDTIPTDDLLNGAISELRRVFQDDPKNPQVIETIPRVGYRLIAPVAPLHLNGHASDSKRAMPRGLVGIATIILVGLASWWYAATPDAPAPPLRPSQLTSYPHQETQPALSPDARHVAFAWQGETGDNWDIYVRLLDGDAPTRLTADSSDERSPVWSADGSEIAFIRRSAAACEVVAVTVLGRDERTLATCPPGTPPMIAWSPDGETVIVSERPSPEVSFSLISVSVATGERHQLTPVQDQHWGDAFPAFSPDGNQLAFLTSASMSEQQLKVLSLQDGAEPQMLWEGTAITGHAWSPDGNHLAVASQQPHRQGLWRVPASGGAPTWLGVAAYNPASVSWQGNALVYEERDVVEQIQRLNLTDTRSSDLEPWGRSTRSDFMPQVSPDGSQVAFVSDRTGTYELWIGQADGTDLRAITAFGDAFLGWPAWSPDGHHVAFEVHRDGYVAITVIDVATETVRQITQGPANSISPSWSSDGQSVYVGTNRSGSWHIAAVPVDGGEPKQVIAESGYTAHEATGGLYLVRPDRPGLWRHTSDSEGLTLVPNTDDVDVRTHWGPIGDDLSILSRKPDGLALRILNPETGALLEEIAVPVEHPGRGVAFSPDRSTVLMTSVVEANSDLMLVSNVDR